MQYETIILELLARIKNLEEDVAHLKMLSNQSSKNLNEESKQLELHQDINENNVPTSYKKMTEEMIEICYKCGKKVFQGENPQDLADEISYETGMNRNSAIMYLYAVSGMLGGTIYKRSISAKAMQKYFDLIFNEFGVNGLKKAINATKLHIDYRRECGQQVDSIEEICDKYERRL